MTENEKHAIDIESKCLKWMEESDVSSLSETNSISGTSYSLTASSMEEPDFCDVNNLHISSLTDKNSEVNVLSNQNSVSNKNHTEILSNVFASQQAQNFGNIQIDNSNKVHIGNVTYITGPIHIHSGGQNPNIISKSEPAFYEGEGEGEEEGVEHIGDEYFVKNLVVPTIDTRILKIIDRRSWLAQPALQYEFMPTPVPYIIISHTATECSSTQAEMTYLVRLIQGFHIESRRFSDIGYNFLVGNDGNVYEGRGWDRVGGHTYGYNRRAIGISFVGCFMNIIPEKVAIETCKLLIQTGVNEGKICPDYKLLGHCQCAATESPGKMLFKEIQTWDHWAEKP